MLTSLWLCFLQHLDENSPLGDLLRGVLDVPACQIGELPFLSLDSSGVGVSLRFPLLLRRKPVAESPETITFWKLQPPLSSPAFALHAYPVPDTVESEVGRAPEYKLTSVLMV